MYFLNIYRFLIYIPFRDLIFSINFRFQFSYKISFINIIQHIITILFENDDIVFFKKFHHILGGSTRVEIRFVGPQRGTLRSILERAKMLIDTLLNRFIGLSNIGLVTDLTLQSINYYSCPTVVFVPPLLNVCRFRKNL